MAKLSMSHGFTKGVSVDVLYLSNPGLTKNSHVTCNIHSYYFISAKRSYSPVP